MQRPEISKREKEENAVAMFFPSLVRVREILPPSPRYTVGVCITRPGRQRGPGAAPEPAS